MNLVHQELPPVSRLHWTGVRGWAEPNLHVDLSVARRFKAGNNSREMHGYVTELLRTKYADHHHRYTDGSKATGKVGLGIADHDASISSRLPDQCSVFSAEGAAIFYAATMHANKPICILSDSASVLTALESQTSSHPWIQGIQLEAPKNTAFLWIPGHCNIRGNCEADQLAATGRSGRLATKFVPGPDIKVWVKSILRKAWTLEWATKTEPFLRKIKGETTKWQDSPIRQDQLILSRLRCGHTRTTHNMGSATSFRKHCDICNTTMTVEHFLVNCPGFQGIRNLYGIPSSVRNALANDPSTEAAVICFIKDAKLYRNI